jgi:hypothetical protein
MAGTRTVVDAELCRGRFQYVMSVAWKVEAIVRVVGASHLGAATSV